MTMNSARRFCGLMPARRGRVPRRAGWCGRLGPARPYPPRGDPSGRRPDPAGGGRAI
jgi:hypothetical protein